MTTTKNRHNDQRSVTLWLQQQLADQVDQAIAAKLALVPGATMSRQTFITHAIQKALQGAGEAPPAQSPTAALPAPTVQPVAPAQHVQAAAEPAQAAQTEVQRPDSEQPIPELLAAFRAMFRAMVRHTGKHSVQHAEYYETRPATDAELADADRQGDTLYANLLDFALAAAAGKVEAPFCPITGWDDIPRHRRELSKLFSVFDDIGDHSFFFTDLPGPFAAAQARHVEAQAKAKAREDKAAAKAARAAQRAAKKTARPAPLPPMPQQLLPEQPVLVASPFGAGPSES